MDFREAERHYADLKRQRDAGKLSAEEFDTRLKELLVQDDRGRWWAKSRGTGEWHYYEGNRWVQGTPPGHQPPPPVPSEDAAGGGLLSKVVGVVAFVVFWILGFAACQALV